MTDSKNIVELRDVTGALAVLRPDLGGWLLRYARPLPGRGLVEALHYDPAVVARYPKEMWAGNPILFPHVSFNVAREVDGQYELDGTLYQSPQHGFGRRVPWMIVEQSSATVAHSHRCPTAACRICRRRPEPGFVAVSWDRRT